MTRLRHILLRLRFVRDETGAALVEFAVVVALFFLIFFALLDFGRLMYTIVQIEKASQIAARIASVRGPACGNLPASLTNTPASGTVVQSGTSCDQGTNYCIARSFSCGSITRNGSDFPSGTIWSHAPTVDAANTTVAEIWSRIEVLLPPGTTVDALNFRYDYDQALGFVGGPYTPIVTVEFDLPEFEFVSPLGGLADFARGGTGAVQTGTIPLPDFSVSLPAEDLVNGPS